MPIGNGVASPARTGLSGCGHAAFFSSMLACSLYAREGARRQCMGTPTAFLAWHSVACYTTEAALRNPYRREEEKKRWTCERCRRSVGSFAKTPLLALLLIGYIDHSQSWHQVSTVLKGRKGECSAFADTIL